MAQTLLFDFSLKSSFCFGIRDVSWFSEPIHRNLLALAFNPVPLGKGFFPSSLWEDTFESLLIFHQMRAVWGLVQEVGSA
jgi:hypothetical protein